MVVYFVILPYIVIITSIIVGDDAVQYESKERNIMEETQWNMKTTTITEWMSANDISPYPALAAVGGLVDAGNNADEATRDSLYNAIKQCFTNVENSPIRKGRGSNLPADVEAAINATISALKTDLMTCWEASPSIQNCLVKHGRSGGGQFGSGPDYAEDTAEVARKRLVAGWKAAQEGKEADYHTVISDGVAISVHQGVA